MRTENQGLFGFLFLKYFCVQIIANAYARSSLFACVLFDWCKPSMQSLDTGFCRTLTQDTICTWRVFALICRSDLRCLSGYPRSQAYGSWAGPRDKATVLSCETTLAAPRAPRLALYFVLGLCSFCYAVSAARHAQSRSILRFLVVRRVFRGSLQEHDNSISKIPAALLRDHHTNYPIDPH